MSQVYKTPSKVYISKSMYDTRSQGWKNQELRVKEIQKEFGKGFGAKICIIDDGIGLNDELPELLIDRYSYLRHNAESGDHSTLAATVIAGKSIGIFPEISLISKQVLDPISGTGGTREIISAIYKAKELGIGVINLSLGTNAPDPELEKALEDYCDNGKNIATIASGNDGNATDYPAHYAKYIKGVLSIAATQIDASGNVTIAAFSSRGVVTIAAPGHVLKSMDMRSHLDLISGTSFSAPIVGSAIAVAKTIDPELTQDEILFMLANTSKDLGEPKPTQGSGQISILDFLREVKKGEAKNVIVEVEPKPKMSLWCKLVRLFAA